MACHSRGKVGVEIADVLVTYASFRELILNVYVSKDKHCSTQEDTQLSQTCSGESVNT